MSSPLLILACAFVSGIGAGEFFHSRLGGLLFPLTILTACTTLATLAAARRRGNRFFLFTLTLTAFLAGCLHLLHDRSRTRTIFPEEERIYTGILEQTAKISGKHRTLDIRLCDGRCVKIYDYSDTKPPQPGDTVVFRARITEPRPADFTESFDYRAYLRRHHFDGHAPVRHLAVTGHAEGFRLSQLREQLVGRLYEQFDGPTPQVLAATTLGWRASMNDDIRDTFRDAGASHALALSGLHLSILFMIFETLVTHRLRRSRFRLAADIAGICLIWAFTAFTGTPPSLQRAALMCTLYKSAQILRRGTEPATSLGTAAVIMLVVNPQNLFDTGFQLSFVSVAGILWLVPLWRFLFHRPEGRFRHAIWLTGMTLWSMFGVSLAASLATFPLVAYHFHTVPLYGPLSNFIVIPALYLILGLGLLFHLCPLSIPLTASLLSAITGLMLSSLKTIAALPYASIPFAPGATFVATYYLLLLCVIRRKWLAAACTSTVMAATLIPQPQKPQIIIYDTPTPLVHCIESRTRSCLWTPYADHRTREAVSRIAHDYWARMQMTPPSTVAAAGDLARTRSGLLCFGKTRIIVAGLEARPEMPHGSHADILYLVSAPTDRQLIRLFEHLRPTTVILGRRLSAHRRKKVGQIARRAHINVHDLRSKGAFRLSVTPGQTPTTPPLAFHQPHFYSQNPHKTACFRLFSTTPSEDLK